MGYFSRFLATLSICLVIAVAIYVTKSPYPLFALLALLVIW